MSLKFIKIGNRIGAKQKKASFVKNGPFTQSVLFLLVLATIFSSIALPVANASATSLTLRQKALAYYLPGGLFDCLKTKYNFSSDIKSNNGLSLGTQITSSDVDSGNWFKTTNSDGSNVDGYSSYVPYDTSTTSCNVIVKNTSSVLGYDNPGDFMSALLKTAGYSTNEAIKEEVASTTDETKTLRYKLALAVPMVALQRYSKLNLKYSSDNTLTGAVQYEMYARAFFSADGCAASKDSSASGDNAYTNVNTIDDNGNKSGTNYSSLKAKSTKINIYYDMTAMSAKSMTCADIASNINKTVDSLKAYFDSHPSEKKDIISLSDENNESADSSIGDACSDNVTGIAWLACPLINGLASLNDGAWSIVKAMLVTNPLSMDGSNNLYTAWTTMRNLANVIFVIVFLIVILSQLTGIGISDYGIKTMLPKLIVGVIVINLSFIMMQIVVDLCNIIGNSLYNVIVGLAPQVEPSGATLVQELSQAALAGSLTVAGVALSGGVGAAFLFLLPSLLAAALALLAAFITLVIRQAAIPILAILAPFAILASALPNTKPWFEKWKKILTDMLMLFPLAAVLFAGSRFAGQSIMGTDPDWWDTLIGMLVMILPLFSLPFLAKQGGSIASAVMDGGKKLSGLAQKGLRENLTDDMAKAARAKSEAASLAGNRGGLFKARRSFIRGGLKRKAIVSSREAELNRAGAEYISKKALNYDKFARQMAGSSNSESMNRVRASALKASDKFDDEAVENAELLMRSGSNAHQMIGDAQAAFERAVLAGDKTTAKAATNILLSSGGAGLDKLTESIRSVESNQGANLSVLESVQGKVVKAGIKGKHAYLDKWSTDTRSIDAIMRDTKVTSGLNAAEFSGQTNEAFKNADSIGGITADQANAMKAVDKAQGSLSDEKRDILKKY